MFVEDPNPSRAAGRRHAAVTDVLDLAAAIGDMIRFDGARPLRCLA